jgi:acetylornithine/N-succinyldiaminopimelate aminotransferase
MDLLLGHIQGVGDYFRGELQKLAEKHSCVKEVRGVGLMLALDLDSAERAKMVVKILLSQGILINRTQETVLRFLPPYIIGKVHVDNVIRALNSALATASAKSGPKAAHPKTIRRRAS